MDYEAARHVLSSPADWRSLKALEKFLEANLAQLRRCDASPTGPLRAKPPCSPGSRAPSDAKTEAANLGISEAAAAYAISQALSSGSDKIAEVATSAHCSVVRLVTELVKGYDGTPPETEKQRLVSKFVPLIVADEQFFPRIFTAIGAGKLAPAVLASLLELVFTALFYVIPDSSTLIVDWMELAAVKSLFFVKFSPANRALATLIVLQFLNLHQDFSLGHAGFSYFKDGAALVSLRRAMEGAPAAIEVAWALVLHNVALRYSERPDKSLAGLLEACRAKGGEDLDTRSGELLMRALNANGLRELVDLADAAGPLLQASQTVADVLQALCRCVHVSQELAEAIDEVLTPYPVLARGFFDDEFVATAVDLAKAKVPAALPTFVHLARAVGPAANDLVANLGSFIDEVDARDLEIRGTEAVARAPLTLLPPRATDGQGAIVLPAQSVGQVLNDGERPLVMWSFQYNGWSLLARTLESSEADGLAIVRLISTVLPSLDAEGADRLLGSLSASLARSDIVELLGSRLESAMGDFSRVKECTVLLGFFTVLAPVLPHRVWTYLSRSRLLEQRGEAGFVAAVVGGVEIFSHRYEFTLQVTRLVRALLLHLDDDSLQLEVLGKLLRHLLDVFESFSYWTYADPRERPALLSGIVDVFATVCEGAPAAVTAPLLDQLLGRGPASERAIYPLLEAVGQTAPAAVYAFAAWLVRYRSTHNREYSLLEHKLHDSAAQLVQAYCQQPALRAPVLEVLEALVSAGGLDQPSLLAYLGGRGSQLLLDALVQSAGSDLELDDALVALCSFFSAVARSQQEGLLILLASGRDVQNAPTAATGSATVLEALERLALRDLSPRVLAAALEALAEGNSANEAVVTRAVDLVEAAYTETFEPSVEGAYRVLVVARAMQILASLAFRGHKSAALAAFTKTLSPARLEGFTERFFSVQGFDVDLHDHVHRQFVALKPAPQPAARAVYGPDFSYSRAHLDRCLGDKPEWAALRPRIAAANVNLSFIDSQTELVRYWRAWCMAVLTRGDLGAELATVAQVSLRANLSDLEVPYFAAGAEMRIDLAFFILHHLYKAGKLSPSLAILQEALRLLTGPVDATPSATPSYKYLLRIVNLALSQFDKVDAKLAELLLGLLDRVVISDARVVANLATAETAASTAEIFVEITLCLRQSLALLTAAGSVSLQPLLQSMLDTGTDRAVARMYSYALDLQPGDPVLGELALLYFLEWLPLSIMADHFVANGLLTVLLEAPLSRKIQAGNVVASVEPRLHSAWQRGLLMIVLVLLQQLGSRVVPETALFIESFEPQIDTCWQQWIQPTGEISIALVGETFLISILLATLASHGRHEALAKVLPQNELLQAIDHLSSHRKYLATRVPAPDSLDHVVEEMTDLRNVIAQR